MPTGWSPRTSATTPPRRNKPPLDPQSIPLYRSIHFRLVLLFSLVVLLGAAVNGYLTLRKTESEFRRLLADQFTSAIAITENTFDLVGQMALVSARHLVGDAPLGAAMCSGRKLPEAGFLKFRADVGADLLVVLDANGRIRFHSGEPQLAGDSLRSAQLVRQAIDAGTTGSAIFEDVDNLVIYSSGVRYDATDPAGRLCGVVLVGYVINDRLIGNVSQNSPVGITIIRRNAVMASTFNQQQKRLTRSPVPYVEYQGWLDDPATIRRARINDQVYFASARRLKLMEPLMEGSMLLTQEESGLANIQRGLSWYHFWTFLATLVIVVLVSARFTLQLLRPLRLLLQHSQDILARREIKSIVISRQDEVGILARHLNQMMVDLRLNNELLEKTVAERTAALQLANRSLEEQATHDSLTGLPNRRLFEDRLEQALKHAARYHSQLALLFLDIDRFKWVNDNEGHAVGDELLQEVAGRLSGLVRCSDTVARLGGDEFTIILDRINGDAGVIATTVAAKVVAALGRPFILAETTVKVGGSVGIAVYPDHADNAEDLVFRADSAMYEAKKKGKGCACLYVPETLDARTT